MGKIKHVQIFRNSSYSELKSQGKGILPLFKITLLVLLSMKYHLLITTVCSFFSYCILHSHQAPEQTGLFVQNSYIYTNFQH